jgi:hypothetical protein
MRSMLSAYYRACSQATRLGPNQLAALAYAESALGRHALPEVIAREAWNRLGAAFNNSPAARR